MAPNAMNPFDLNLARAYRSPAAFCPRPDVHEVLARAQAAKLWTLLDGDRRLGKSCALVVSCVTAGWPLLHVDLMGVTTEDAVNDSFRWGWELFQQQDTLGFFSRLKPEISAKVPFTDVTVKVAGGDAEKPSTWADIIGAFDRRCAPGGGILFIDELQDLRRLPSQGMTLTRKLRARLQLSRHLTPVLAGSSQSLLSPMFATASAPFFKSIRLQKHVGPLEREGFRSWAGRMFEKQGRGLESAAVERLFAMTEGVTEDLVATCAEIWMQGAGHRSVSPADVEVAWRNVVANAVSLFLPDISRLPPAQARLLRYIARNPRVQPFAASTLKDLGESRSTVHHALGRLIELELVRERESDGRKRVWVHDPRIAFYLR